MTKSVQTALVLMKAVAKTPQGGPATGAKGKTTNGVSGFAELLGNIAVKPSKTSDLKTADLKKMLGKLLGALKQFEGTSEPVTADSKEAKSIVRILKEVVAFLNGRKTSLSAKNATKKETAEDPEIDRLLAEAGQLELLFLPQQRQESHSGHSVNPESVSKLMSQLVKSIESLLQNNPDPTMPKANNSQSSALFQEGSFRQIRNKNEQQQTKTAKHNSLQTGSQATSSQPKGLLGVRSSVQSSSLQNDTRNRLASVFQRVMAKPDNDQQIGGFHSGPMHRLQQLAIHVRQNGNSPNGQQFVRDFEQILSKGIWTNTNGKQQLTLKLYPRHLGTLNIQLTRQNGQLTATLMTSTQAAKNLVESNLHQLQGAFINQNINVQKLQVLPSYVQAQGQPFQDYQGSHQESHHQQQHEQQQQHESGHDEEEMSFMDWLEQPDDEWEANERTEIQQGKERGI